MWIFPLPLTMVRRIESVDLSNMTKGFHSQKFAGLERRIRQRNGCWFLARLAGILELLVACLLNRGIRIQALYLTR